MTNQEMLVLQERLQEKNAQEKLYEELKKISTAYAIGILRKKLITFTRYQIEEYAHDAATRLLMRMLTKAHYKVRNFKRMVYLESLKAIFGNCKEEQHTIDTDIGDLLLVVHAPWDRV